MNQLRLIGLGTMLILASVLLMYVGVQQQLPTEPEPEANATIELEPNPSPEPRPADEQDTTPQLREPTPSPSIENVTNTTEVWTLASPLNAKNTRSQVRVLTSVCTPSSSVPEFSAFGLVAILVAVSVGMVVLRGEKWRF